MLRTLVRLVMQVSIGWCTIRRNTTNYHMEQCHRAYRLVSALGKRVGANDYSNRSNLLVYLTSLMDNPVGSRHR